MDENNITQETSNKLVYTNKVGVCLERQWQTESYYAKRGLGGRSRERLFSQKTQKTVLFAAYI